MVSSTATGAAGLVTSVLLAGQASWNDAPPPKVRLEVNPSFLAPGWDETQPYCQFYNGSYQYADGLCSHFSIARMSAALQQEALSRAMDCATVHETDCVLSPEIGLSVPSAFVYDEQEGLRMLIAPKFMPLESDADPEPSVVDVQLPQSGKKTGMRVAMNRTVRVEYMEGGTRDIKQSTLTGSAAHCAQLLRLAFAEDCWEQID